MDSLHRRVARIAALSIGVDLTTKLVATGLVTSASRGPIVPVRNPASSLGIVSGPVPVLLAVALLGIVIAGHFGLRAARSGRVSAWVPGLLIGGATANLLDRAAFGAVHDFLATPWCVFNLADVAVAGALAALLVQRPNPTHRAALPGR